MDRFAGPVALYDLVYCQDDGERGMLSRCRFHCPVKCAFGVERAIHAHNDSGHCLLLLLGHRAAARHLEVTIAGESPPAASQPSARSRKPGRQIAPASKRPHAPQPAADRSPQQKRAAKQVAGATDYSLWIAAPGESERPGVAQ